MKKLPLLATVALAIAYITACDDSSSTSADDEVNSSSSSEIADSSADNKHEPSSSVESSSDKDGSSSSTDPNSANDNSSSSESISSAGDSKCGTKTYDSKTQFCASRSGVIERVYNKVTFAIGKHSKTWMAQNLNYATAKGSYCNPDVENYCDTYGRLYTWTTAVGKTEEQCGTGHHCELGTGLVQGVCPDGWHLPTYEEWDELLTYVNGAPGEESEYYNDTDYQGLAYAHAGKKLKANVETWTNKGKGSDDYGFSILPAGFMEEETYKDPFHFGGVRRAHFWSATELYEPNEYEPSSFQKAFGISLYGDTEDTDEVTLEAKYHYKGFSYSVRCVMDSE